MRVKPVVLPNSPDKTEDESMIGVRVPTMGCFACTSAKVVKGRARVMSPGFV